MIVDKFKTDVGDDPVSGMVEIRGRSLWQDAGIRFARNRAAVAGAVILTVMVLLSFIAPWLTPWNYEDPDWNLIGNAAAAGYPNFTNSHYFGVDDLGRDLFARTMQGTQISLLVGLVGTIVAVGIGVSYGAIAGYVGGRIDNYMMRFVDFLMSIPYMFILIILFVMFGRSLWLLFVGIGLFSWMDMARIVRGQTLAIKSREYIEASVAAGVGTFTIIVRHVLPNLLGIVAVYATILLPSLILTESFISFLGLGVQEPLTSWGALISEGAGTIQYGTPWQLGFPLAFFVVGLFCFYFVGDGLRDALDPKDR